MIKSIKTLITTICLVCIQISAQEIPKTFQNPILKGGFPDPSICRVEDTYYIANSSFIWYPGVPIHKSKDLINWELVSYVLNTPKHLDINDRTGKSGGIWAPTLRYDNGLFYLTVTQKKCGTSIVTTAKNIEGPWSEPITLHSENGIDGSLLFDGDKAWYCWSEDHEILFQEFDKLQNKLIGEKILLLDEHMFGNDYSNIEGPHIYKLKTGEYMLLIASGGTGSNNHNVSVFKSSYPQGPYKPCPNNPVLTHKGTNSAFNNIGHADIVETQNGEWYAVTLGVRPYNGFTIMDRETFLVKFEWENGWPVFNPEGNGLVLETDKRPNLPWTPINDKKDINDFLSPELSKDFNFYHTPKSKWWHLNDQKGCLRINLQPENTTQQTNIPVIARRITEFDFDAITNIDFDPKKGEAAGLIVMMNQNGQMRLEVCSQNGNKAVRLVTYALGRNTPLEEYVSESTIITSKTIKLKVKARALDYRFFVESNNGKWLQIGKVVNGEIISRQKIGSYSGAYVGIFATSNGEKSSNHADFNSFIYQTQNLENK